MLVVEYPLVAPCYFFGKIIQGKEKRIKIVRYILV
jgi:hypothetical protein